MKTTLTLITLFAILNYQKAAAQHSTHAGYLSNIVSIGANSFGFIVGADSRKCYFVTAEERRAGEDPAYPEVLPVHFYNVPAAYQGELIRKFTLGTTQVSLYAVSTPPPAKWTPRYFRRHEAAGVSDYTFLVNDNSLTRWYANTAPLEFNLAPDDQHFQLRTTPGNVYFRGMPVADLSNNITGIIATEPSGQNNTLLFTVVDMQAIADRIFGFSDCTYFQLIQAGQPANRCEISKIAEASGKRLARRGAFHAFAFGPEFTASLLAASASSGSNQPGGRIYSTGFNIETWPDQGRMRLVMKPRYQFIHLNVPENITPRSPIGYQAKTFDWQNAEMPLLLEFLFDRHVGGNTFWGIGYAPGFQFDVRYKYITTANAAEQTATARGTQAFSSKVLAEIGAEIGHTRIELFAGYQLSAWHRSATYSINNRQVNPFEGISDKYLMIGLSLSFRLGSWWGLRSIR